MFCELANTILSALHLPIPHTTIILIDIAVYGFSLFVIMHTVVLVIGYWWGYTAYHYLYADDLLV